MYYDPLFLVLFVGECMHGLHWGRRILLVVARITRSIWCEWDSGRVDSELMALIGREQLLCAVQHETSASYRDSIVLDSASNPKTKVS